MKILGLISGNEGYGVRRAWLGLSEQFKKKGVDLSFASVNKGNLSHELQEKNLDVTILLDKEFKNIKPGNLKFFYMIYRVFLQLLIIPKIISKLKKNKIDAVLFRNPMEVMLMGVVSKLTGVKSFWLMPNSVSNDYPFDLNRKIYRFIFKYCNVTPIANSKYTLSTLGNIPNGNFSYLGIDPQLFINSKEMRDFHRKKLNISEDDIVVGIFARMTPEKGQSLMIDAINALGDKALNVHLLLGGAGNNQSYNSEIQDKISKYNLSDRIHLLGAVNNVVDYYCACDIVANTRLDPEPFGFSVIEAMMMGIPVLAHKSGGPGETVIDGVTGWHIDAPNLEAFVSGLERAIDEKDQWYRYKQQSVKTALEFYTSEQMTQRIVNIIVNKQ